jgi:hypothetical protein
LITGEPLRPVEVSIEEFPRSDWPLARWGCRAVVYAGQGNKDHLRAALQLLSGPIPRRVVHTFTGWCQISETWVYLHAGGAIGPNGTVENVAVDLPGALENYRLPAPPEGEERIAAVRASLALAGGLAPDEVVLPLLATTYGAVLNGATIATHVSGRTGSGKTELAALMQQHFGPEMSAKRLPANWSSTGNALEALAFAAKDTLLAVDDFCPVGSQADVARYHKEADRVFRAQGNRSGRLRCRQDGSPRSMKNPRGTILSTGEDVPHGHSLRAGMMIVELGANDVKFERLSAHQKHAADGRYAQAMAAYLQWLAPEFKQLSDGLKAESARLRDEIIAGPGGVQHKRTPTMVAELLCGFRLFLEFAEAIGAIDDEQAVELGQRCRQALLKTAAEQAGHQDASDASLRYLDLLRSVLLSGRAHVVNHDGGKPSQLPQACGWQPRASKDSFGDEWYPQGKCIGWLDGENLYLDPDVAYAEANRLAGEQGGSLGVGKNTLHKRLSEHHLLASVDSARNRLIVRHVLAVVYRVSGAGRHKLLRDLGLRLTDCIH